MLEKAAALKRFEYSLLGKELKTQTGVAKDQYKFFKNQVNNFIDKKEEHEDKKEEDKREEDERKTVKNFDAILKDIKNNGKASKLLIIRTRGNIVSLRPLIIKLINARKTVLEKNYGFDIFLIILIIKKHETLTTIPPIHVYVNRINNRLLFKIKDGYKLELQTPATMLHQKINRQNKKRRKRTKSWSSWSSFSPM